MLERRPIQFHPVASRFKCTLTLSTNELANTKNANEAQGYLTNASIVGNTVIFYMTSLKQYSYNDTKQ